MAIKTKNAYAQNAITNEYNAELKSALCDVDFKLRITPHLLERIVMQETATEVKSTQERQHQKSETEYQIRTNGSPVAWYPYFDKYTLAEYSKVCNDNEGEYVDIVSVRTEILLNQGSYHQMKLHFSQA